MSYNKPDISELLNRYGLRPRKSLGQNFLVDDDALNRVAAAAQIQPDQAILEIGPGLGSLTSILADFADRVVCVELDRTLIPPLREVLKGRTNIEIVQGDILTLDPSTLMCGSSENCRPSYLVVANIPYYITSALMRHLLETRCPPKSMVLTVQREVAERISAEAGDMSLLALSVQVYGRTQIFGRIPAGAFYPVPQVDSAILQIQLYDNPLIPAEQLADFFRLAKAAFSQKRKTIRNALAGGMHWLPSQAEAFLLKAGVEPMRRAETLSLMEWKNLVGIYQSLGTSSR